MVHMYSGILCSVAQSCMTVFNSIVCSLQGSSVHGIFLAKLLEQVAISSSKGSSSSRDWTHISGIFYISTLTFSLSLSHLGSSHMQQNIVCVCAKLLQSCLTPCNTKYGLWPPRLLCPWDSPGQNIEVGCHFLLQKIVPTEGSDLHFLHLLHFRQILYHLNYR